MSVISEDQLRKLGEGSLVDGLESVIGDGLADDVESVEGSEPQNMARVGNWILATDSQGFQQVRGFDTEQEAEVIMEQARLAPKLARLRWQEEGIERSLQHIRERVTHLDALPEQDGEAELRALAASLTAGGKVLLESVRRDIAEIEE